MKKFLLFIVLLIYGCSSTPIIQTKVDTIYVHIPAVADTIALQDTILQQDTVGIGEVRDSLNNIIGSLKVSYKKKIAWLLLNPKTITHIDTQYVEIKKTSNLEEFGIRLLQTFFATFTIIEKILLIILVTAGLFIYFKVRKKEE